MSSKIPRAKTTSTTSGSSEMKATSSLNNLKNKKSPPNHANAPAMGRKKSASSSSTNRNFIKQNATFSHGTQKTMSYTQLKQEVGVLQEENCDLRNKMTKQQNALHSSQKTTQHLQKENKELKEKMEISEKDYRGTMEARTEEWTSRNTQLEGRLSECEVKLEELGVDPVSLDKLNTNVELHSHQQKAQENANILKQKFEENIVRSQQYIQQIKDISSQCGLALAELDVES